MHELVPYEDNEELDLSILEEKRQQYEQKKFELECETERVDKFEQALEQSCPAVVSRYGDLRQRLQEITMQYEDDIEAEPYVEEAKSLLDGDEADVTEQMADAADELSTKELRNKCKTIFYAISKRTHPDSCVVQTEEVTQLFHDAKSAYERLDLSELLIIYAIVSNGLTSNLIAAYETKISDVEAQLDELRETQMYYYYTINLEDGFNTAAEEYKLDLLEKIQALETMINREYEIL